MAWIPPELRENCGEVEAALEGRLPELVELKHIRGDLHMHTTETDGKADIRAMAESARREGLEYIAITDHTQSLAMANGLDENTLVMFSSDHGPWYQGSPGRLRGRKGESFEGGVRVPFVARFPATGETPATGYSIARYFTIGGSVHVLLESHV